MNTNKIRVFIVSQQFLFRQGIEHSLSSIEDIEILYATEVNDKVLSAIDTLPPDVALVDIDGPADDSLTLARKIKQRSPNIGLIVLASNPNDTQLFRVLKAHTRPKVAEQVLLQFQELSWRSEVGAFISPLTPREMEILNYISQGSLNKEIAVKLGISEQTIKNHVTSILRKLNANARTEAVVIAIKQGLISLD